VQPADHAFKQYQSKKYGPLLAISEISYRSRSLLSVTNGCQVCVPLGQLLIHDLANLPAATAKYYHITSCLLTRLSLVLYCAASDLFTLTSLIHSSGTRGYTCKLFPHCNRVDLYKYFFSQRILDT